MLELLAYWKHILDKLDNKLRNNIKISLSKIGKYKKTNNKKAKPNQNQNYR